MKAFCILAFIRIKSVSLCLCYTWSIDEIWLTKKMFNTFPRTITEIEQHLKSNSQKTSLAQFTKFHSCKIFEKSFLAKGINSLRVVQYRRKQLNQIYSTWIKNRKNKENVKITYLRLLLPTLIALFAGEQVTVQFQIEKSSSA